jgi:hypothetical protein
MIRIHDRNEKAEKDKNPKKLLPVEAMYYLVFVLKSIGLQNELFLPDSDKMGFENYIVVPLIRETPNDPEDLLNFMKVLVSYDSSF